MCIFIDRQLIAGGSIFHDWKLDYELLNVKKGIVTRISSITIPLYILIMFDQPAIVPINESHVLLTHL